MLPALFAALFLLCTVPSFGQAAEPKCDPPQSDSSFVDPDGTAHVTRVVPVPTTLSPEAQKWLAQHVPEPNQNHETVQERARAEGWQEEGGAKMKAVYPVNLAKSAIAGVPVRIITPLSTPESKRDRVLINVHGGGFQADWGSTIETIPIANLTQTKVVAVLYRMAPEHPFPAAVDDTVAVYKELLKTYKPQNIGLYGTSAGAILTAEVAVKLRQLGLPLPAALGIFSGNGDFSRNGDAIATYSLFGLAGPLSPPNDRSVPPYAGATNPKDPVLSPIYADLKGFPPTLFLTSGRDLLLSGTVNLHRAFVQAGIDAELVVWDALPHAFWNEWNLPESQQAHRMMAGFFDRKLGK